MGKTRKSESDKKKEISVTETAPVRSVQLFKSKRKSTINPQTLVDGILNQDIAALSRAITLVESQTPKHAKQAQTIVQACLPQGKPSIRIGITGVPGVGKSTFIEALGKHLIDQGKRVAVLAIDPSSSITKGSILGDKTRMEHLSKSHRAFIRPSASGQTLGGVARKTRESIILCEAAGFDVIIVETVGVGQSETAVHSMVDFFLLLKLAGAGDELQGIKRGIIEMADAIVINKADGNNLEAAKLAENEFKRALQFYPEKASAWPVKITRCSALNNEGIKHIWELVLDYVKTTTTNGYFNKKRQQQNEYWLIQTIEERLKSQFFDNQKVKKELKNQLQLLSKNQTTPFVAAEVLLKLRLNESS